ncbi:MAG: hypothetical protein VX568_08910 [Actinomycetota bacterium]|nr:hypothetical protein [Actinomycetota bacterium]
MLFDGTSSTPCRLYLPREEELSSPTRTVAIHLEVAIYQLPNLPERDDRWIHSH